MTGNVLVTGVPRVLAPIRVLAKRAQHECEANHVAGACHRAHGQHDLEVRLR